ncbi:MAG TPA: SAM-dependent chlorinase/fluorinase [Candidatus Eisenbacteria bacterium]|jgi:S-adenosylmethionine hydrolase
MPHPIVTFLSDFGHADWFVGVVHGVLYSLAPEAHVVDLAHSVPPGDIARGAFLLEAAAGDFPPGTVHLAVVDPGVGTSRRALAVAARGQFFVGPDNGLLEWALCTPGAEARALTETRYFRAPVSRTFHGRDVFAPVAAALARGEKFAAFGAPVADPVRLPAHDPVRRGDALVGRVVFLDRFGNALTNLTEQAIAEAFGPGADDASFLVRVLDRRIEGLARSYGDAGVGTLVAIVGSSGRLEIAQVGGAATLRLGIGEGDAVEIRRR